MILPIWVLWLSKKIDNSSLYSRDQTHGLSDSLLFFSTYASKTQEQLINFDAFYVAFLVFNSSFCGNLNASLLHAQRLQLYISTLSFSIPDPNPEYRKFIFSNKIRILAFTRIYVLLSTFFY